MAVERLARKYKVEVETAAPTIPYQETITGGTEIHSRYKHQTGGHGQFGDVWLRFEPRERGAGVTFEEKIVGGVVPRQFIPAVEKGVREALARGASGYPVTDLHVTLFDGQYHDVDSSEQSFKTAAGMGVREALPKCNPVVLEPIAYVRVTVPTRYTSTVIQQLTGKRGQILGMNPADDGRASTSSRRTCPRSSSRAISPSFAPARRASVPTVGATSATTRCPESRRAESCGVVLIAKTPTAAIASCRSFSRLVGVKFKLCLFATVLVRPLHENDQRDGRSAAFVDAAGFCASRFKRRFQEPQSAAEFEHGRRFRRSSDVRAAPHRGSQR